MLNKLIHRKEDQIFNFDYYFSDIALKVFTVFWIIHVIYCYNENSNRPEILYTPIVWLQQWLMPNLPSKFTFYSVVLLSIFLCYTSVISKKIIYRAILFCFLLWLNCIKWNYNFFSHVGHLFLLAHLFTIVLPSANINKNYPMAIRWALAGVLSTYSMAGVWKFATLLYKTVVAPDSSQITWIHHKAAETNAFVSARIWDEALSNFSISIYNIPYLWEIATILIFCIQLFAVIGGINKKIMPVILLPLIGFHVYNIFCINTSFYTATFVLLILFFPYHKIKFLQKYFTLEH